MSELIDVAIIGAGPGGMTAALYSARAGLKTAIFEGTTLGGQMGYTNEIENYPGILKTSGFDLAMIMDEQVKKFGAKYINEEVKSVRKSEFFNIQTSSGEYKSKTVILGLGASPRKLGLESENRLRGSGVSYCATCDGNFYKGADVAVIGGGNTAFEDALFLSKVCRKVYLIHRRDEFRAEQVLQDEVFKTENIEVIKNSVPEDIFGKFEVEKLLIKNKETGEKREVLVQGVFVAVGTNPNSSLIADIVTLNEYGYIITDENMETNIKGMFAVGDVRDTVLRQVVTACADGAIAANAAGKYCR